MSQRQEWREWLRFFLEAVASQACESIGTIKDLEKLGEKYDALLSKKRAGANAKLLLYSLFANPYTTVPRACRVLGRTYPAGKRAIDDLVGIGALRQVGARYRGRVFHAEEIDAIIGKD